MIRRKDRLLLTLSSVWVRVSLSRYLPSLGWGTVRLEIALDSRRVYGHDSRAHRYITFGVSKLRGLAHVISGSPGPHVFVLLGGLCRLVPGPLWFRLPPPLPDCFLHIPSGLCGHCPDPHLVWFLPSVPATTRTLRPFYFFRIARMRSAPQGLVQTTFLKRTSRESLNRKLLDQQAISHRLREK